MKYLAINTCGQSSEVILSNEGSVTIYQEADYRQASVSLLCGIDSLLTSSGLTISQMDYFACNVGTGSFTGIRIAVTTTKTFAYCHNKPIVAVNSHELATYIDNAQDYESIVSIVDGANRVCYLAVYDGSGYTILEPRCMWLNDAKKLVDSIDERILVVADKSLQSSFDSITLPSYVMSRAVDAKIARGQVITYNELEPLYLRSSQAERGAGEL